MKIRSILTFLMFLLITVTSAQQNMRIVDVDLNSGVITSPLPFHEPFLFKGKIDQSILSVNMTLKKMNKNGEKDTIKGKWERKAGIPDDNFFYILCDKVLETNTKYTFNFEITRKLTDTEIASFHEAVKSGLRNKLRSGLAERYCDNSKTLNTDDFNSFLDAIKESMIVDTRLGQIKWPDKGLLSMDTVGRSIAEIKTYMEGTDELFDSYCQRKMYLNNLNSTCDNLYTNLKLLLQNNIIDSLYGYFQQDLKTGKWDYTEFRKNTDLLKKLKSKSHIVLNRISQGSERMPESSLPDLVTDQIKEPKEIWESVVFENRVKYILNTGTEMENLLNFLDKLELYALIDRNFKKKKFDVSGLRATLDLADQSTLAIQEYLERIAGLLLQQEAALENFAKKLSLQATTLVIITGTTDDKDIKTKAFNYIGWDFGLAVAPELKGNVVIPVYGVNFYLAPVNKRVKLSEKLRKEDPFPLKKFSASLFARSFSISTGFTLYSINLDNERKGLLNDIGLLAGVGWRVNRALRLSGGVIMFQKKDPNPLINDYHLGATGYIGISADMDVFGALGKLAGKIFPNL